MPLLSTNRELKEHKIAVWSIPALSAELSGVVCRPPSPVGTPTPKRKPTFVGEWGRLG